MDPKLAASLSHFAFRFCNEQPHDKTLICSPLSAEVVLALTALGSVGDTHAELLSSLGWPDDEALRSLFGFLTSTLKGIEGVTLKIANRVFVTNKRALNPSIKKDAEEVFESGLEQLDFTQRDAAADIMNKWVAEQTDNMIKHVLSPSSLNEDTGLVLVNAIYFQGLWQSPFRKNVTREWPFHINNTTEIKVAMMRKSNENFRYKHSPELKAKILQMFYVGGQASMVFVLPDEIEGLTEMLQKLANGHDLMAEIQDLKSTLCNIMIPKFKVETEINLCGLLPKMGITKIFDKNESGIRMLSNQQEHERLFVSQAVQKAVIEVDEAGTKAAVRTSVADEVRLCRREVPKTESFIANRPFLYILMAKDIPLFLGLVRCGKFATPITNQSRPSRLNNRSTAVNSQTANGVLANQPIITGVNDQKAASLINSSNDIPTPDTTSYNGYPGYNDYTGYNGYTGYKGYTGDNGVEDQTANEVLLNQCIDPTVNISNEIQKPVTTGVEDQSANGVVLDQLPVSNVSKNDFQQ